MEEQSKTEKEYNIALEQYSEKLKSLNLKAEDIYINESEKYPMHPNLFYRLSNVHGFNNMNGKTYKDYLEKWSLRSSK